MNGCGHMRYGRRLMHPSCSCCAQKDASSTRKELDQLLSALAQAGVWMGTENHKKHSLFMAALYYVFQVIVHIC